MSLMKRKIGRRVAGIGVGVALMVLGLQAPASAAVTITALSPTSGPAGCVVVATGTGFKDFTGPGQMLVRFKTGATLIPAADFAAISDTTLWAVVPAALVEGTSYTLNVLNPANVPDGISSTATFLATTGAGGCAPTITSFAPACASAGATVVITGTNLIKADLTGGFVVFAPYGGGQLATHTLPDVDDVTSLSVIVPTGSVDGPIAVVTNVDTVFSTANFLLPPPDCVPATTPEHARAITFKLKKSGAASGIVSSTEDPAFDDCVASVSVKIQKKKKGDGWKTKATATTTDTGSYSANVNAKPGKWRALAPKVELGTPTVTDTCLKAKSAVRKIG
jgi:IPT/TIG domain